MTRKTTAEVLGAYQTELDAAGIDHELIPRLVMDAQRHMLMAGPLVVADDER